MEATFTFIFDSLSLFMVATICILLAKGKPVDWKTSNIEITGVNWARNQKTVTHGIWIWNKPFVITAPSGAKVRMKYF